jgi:hypothetical protein
MPRWLWWLPAVGLAAVFLYAVSRGTFTDEFFAALGVGTATSGAALMAGGLLGFLFGIPRTLQGERPPDVLEQRGDARPEYRVNTNLEQISDWLTKILVGVGLVQLGSLSREVRRLADFVAEGLGADASASSFALALLVYFSLSGFLIAYLWTRLNLTGAFARAEAAVLRTYVDERIGEVKQVAQQQEDHDARALSLVTRQLKPEPTAAPIPQADLDAAVAAASRPIKITIFRAAADQRADNWRTNKRVMEYTIPVFRALIAGDPEKHYHAHFGQLGWALKDSDPPELREAEAMLTEAIQIRGDPHRRGYLLYKFVRAECRIRLDDEFAAGRPSSAERKQAILADLRVAALNDWLRGKLSSDDPFPAWMKLNGVRPQDLGP